MWGKEYILFLRFQVSWDLYNVTLARSYLEFMAQKAGLKIAGDVCITKYGKDSYNVYLPLKYSFAHADMREELCAMFIALHSCKRFRKLDVIKHAINFWRLEELEAYVWSGEIPNADWVTIKKGQLDG
jgi:hypothetical protein